MDDCLTVTLLTSESFVPDKWLTPTTGKGRVVYSSAVSAVAATAESQLYIPIPDHLGTPQELTDREGNLQWVGHYRAWGELAKANDSEGNAASVEMPLRFQGQYCDAETGLHYNRFRHYDPQVGRFITQDPISLAGGVNLYQYAPNPIDWIDPLGLAKKDCPSERHLNNAKKKVNSAEVGDIVCTPTTHPEDFSKIGGKKRLYRNDNTKKVWSKSNTTHSDKQGEWKVGIGKNEPLSNSKITVGVSDGKIIKIDN